LDLSEVVARTQAGDQSAFASLVERYRRMAFGHALSALGDVDLAEDAVQQAFTTAYRSLPKLERPDCFPGWLRGIVRFECAHLRRQRRFRVLPLDAAAQVPATIPDPCQQAEEQDALDRVLAEIHALPPSERDVAILYYVQDHSQREVAAFLNLPVATVNNRLRSARKRLRARGLLARAKDVREPHRWGDDVAARVGQIVRANGLVFDARFPGAGRPAVLNALTVTGDSRSVTRTAQVAQYTDDGLARCIAIDNGAGGTEGLRPGLRVVDTETPIRAALRARAIPRIITAFRLASVPEVLETGIKVIDLLCPYVVGGTIGFAGDMRAGKMVLVEELIRNIGTRPGALSVIVFVDVDAEVSAIQRCEYGASASVQAVYVSVDDPRAPNVVQGTSRLDAVTAFSGDLARRGFYPAVDPLRSTSRALDPAIVGQEHYDVAMAVRRLLERAEHLQKQPVSRPGARSKDDGMTAHRAARIRRFLTQPLFVAETFTGVRGRVIPRHETISACKAILSGACDRVPEDALHMRGQLADVVTEASP
jgi:RNA polymerase sigma factor (sigma-70 family)